MNKILIVEDEEAIRISTQKLLKSNRYETSGARSTQDALDKFKLSDFSLIISALRLPEAPGTDLIQLAGGAPC